MLDIYERLCYNNQAVGNPGVRDMRVWRNWQTR